MSFAAIRIVKNDGEEQTVQVQQLEDNDLPDRGIAIDVEYSDVNFKDGLCITGTLGLVETFPVTAGIDIVGTVTASTDSSIGVGDLVTVNGWGIGTSFDGGFAQRARVDAAWVTPVPKNIDSFTAAAIGTAGYTAALAVLALLNHHVTPKSGPVLVTGASGGAGSVAVALLAALGYHVVASTGRAAEQTYLRGLGAREVIDRAELSGAPQARSVPNGGPARSTPSAATRSATSSPALTTAAPSLRSAWPRASISRSPSSRSPPVTSPSPGSTQSTPRPRSVARRGNCSRTPSSGA